jgi:hypothetical protein
MPAMLIFAILLGIHMQCYAYDESVLATLEKMNLCSLQNLPPTSTTAGSTESDVNYSNASQESCFAALSSIETQSESRGQWPSSPYASDEDDATDADPFLLEFNSFGDYQIADVLGAYGVLNFTLSK